ncbi:MAG TPA: histidine phosphatase family protein [Candidatus Acidoferrum sp.]|nr:histidine phosphatase family protein [Candidatus Acidoferrum sp.]
MSRIYLVRHGQAGTRESYDSLSHLGRRQSRLLGEYFVSQGIRFAAAYTGAMLRQQQTAAEVSQAYARAGACFPDIQLEEAWNEFDLSRVYREIAPALAVEDAEFRRGYAEMCEQMRQYAGAQDAPIHRKWQPCDTRVVDAWIGGRFPYGGETWEQFRNRIAGCQRNIRSMEPQENIIIFTSAVPVAIWAGLSLDICDQRVMWLAGVLYNTSYTIVRSRGEQLRLFAFNAIPHLGTPELRTRR